MVLLDTLIIVKCVGQDVAQLMHNGPYSQKGSRSSRAKNQLKFAAASMNLEPIFGSS